MISDGLGDSMNNKIMVNYLYQQNGQKDIHIS